MLLSPLSRAPVLTGVLGQVKKNRIGSYAFLAPCLEPQFLQGYSAR